jgi:hypothetical protein
MISQVYISPTLEATFGENFRALWGLKKYSDPNSTAIFFGLYTQYDLDVLRAHKFKSIVIWGGGDMRTDSLLCVKHLVNKGLTSTFAYPGEFSKILKDNNIFHKELYVPIKDYSKFTTCPLGDKIYVYRGVKGTRASYFQWNDVVAPLIKHFGENHFIYTDNMSISELIDNFYKKSFVYIKPTPRGGCTAMFELGHMGRKTIGVGHTNLPNFIEYKNISHLIKLIDRESRYIGKIRENVSVDTQKIFCGREWLNLDFWK